MATHVLRASFKEPLIDSLKTRQAARYTRASVYSQSAKMRTLDPGAKLYPEAAFLLTQANDLCPDLSEPRFCRPSYPLA